MFKFIRRKSAQTDSSKAANHLTQFDGFIRCLDTARMRPQHIAQLNAAFPLFFDVYEFRLNPETWQPQMRISKQRPPRRFAGHFDRISFPRRRYYTIAHDAQGNDGCTLLREVFAYSAPNQSVLIADAGHSPDLRILKQHGINPTSPDSLLLLQSDLDAPPKVIIEIPLLTQHVTIPNCVDLRQLRTQEWFCNQFWNGTDEMLFVPTVVQDVKEFTDLLPGFMWPSLGGGRSDEYGSITRAIGNWLRINRVSALIFPSARSDALVKYASGRMSDFYGWNLVDYRGTWDDANVIGPNPITTVLVSGWPRGLPYPCKLAIDGLGSWQIVGPEEYLFRRRETGTF